MYGPFEEFQSNASFHSEIRQCRSYCYNRFFKTSVAQTGLFSCDSFCDQFSLIVICLLQFYFRMAFKEILDILVVLHHEDKRSVTQVKQIISGNGIGLAVLNKIEPGLDGRHAQ